MKYGFVIGIGAVVCCLGWGAAAAELPAIQVENVRQVYHNGEHNAFTDMIEWNGRYWLTFRSCPDGHMVHPTSSIRILTSTDTKTWEEVHQFSVPLRDTRDPHFLAFKGKLFVYTGTWYSGETTLPRDEYDMNKHLGYAVWTEDGETWAAPQPMEGTYGHYIWRAAVQGDTAYLCARRNRGHAQVYGERDLIESAMLKSDDGINWRFHSFFQETNGDETAFVFGDDGAVTALCRRGSGPALLATAPSPYTDWTRTELTEYVGGPLLMPWGSRLLAGGRRNTPEGPKTTLYWLADRTLHAAAELPSGGDNSYPGLLVLDGSRAVVSWYSSHEKDGEGNTKTAIYLADLTITP